MKLVLLLLGVFLFCFLLIGYVAIRDIFYVEDHCQQIALHEVGGQRHWTDTSVISPPWFGHGEKIYIGFYKQLVCEHNDKAFIFF